LFDTSCVNYTYDVAYLIEITNMTLIKKNVKQNLEREVINDVQLTHDVSNQSHMAPLDWFDVTLIINLLDDIGDGESYLKPKKKI
jgi:hypothetical protein